MVSTSLAAILGLLMVSCLWAVCSAHKAQLQHPPSPAPSPKAHPNKIVVGGSEHWRFGFDYSDWALKNGPFHINDTLVFKYDPPNNIASPHSVYLLPNLGSFSKCDLTEAQKLANWTQGGGNGFEFVLQQFKPYYFACGERNGLHCSGGNMKFSVLPIP